MSNKEFSLITSAKFRPAKTNKEEISQQGADRVSAESLARCSTTEARRVLSYEKALALEILPIGTISSISGKVLTVAVGIGKEYEAEQTLKFLGEADLRIVSVPSDVVKKAIFLSYQGDDETLFKSIVMLKHEDPREEAFTAKCFELRDTVGEVGKFLELLVDYAIARKASDLHLIPMEKGTFVTLRIAGMLRTHEEPLCSLYRHRELISRLKIISRLDIAEKKIAQDGAFEISLPQGQKRFIRLGIMPTVYGERAVLRLHGGLELRSIEDIGFEENDEIALKNALFADDGMILFSGPTGSGKSTTMYSALGVLKNRGLNVITIEDPVEVKLPWASQTAIDPKHGMGYADCLRSSLRHDPDAILLGEIRDEESAEVAFQAALTGHVVLSSIHARSAHDVVQRLISLGVKHSIIEKGVRLIVYQRLLPALCIHCRVFDLLGSQQHGFEVFKPAGCKICEMSGFYGRQLVAEILDKRNLIEAVSETEAGTSFRKSLEKYLKCGTISATQFYSACKD